ncbi:MAG: hypothetical protein HDQ44_04345 [Desulfovibrio sp.]|nr:hypothetical protein [Desulfovibrio sp.]
MNKLLIFAYSLALAALFLACPGQAPAQAASGLVAANGHPDRDFERNPGHEKAWRDEMEKRRPDPRDNFKRDRRDRSPDNPRDNFNRDRRDRDPGDRRHDSPRNDRRRGSYPDGPDRPDRYDGHHPEWDDHGRGRHWRDRRSDYGHGRHHASWHHF